MAYLALIWLCWFSSEKTLLRMSSISWMWRVTVDGVSVGVCWRAQGAGRRRTLALVVDAALRLGLKLGADAVEQLVQALAGPALGHHGARGRVAVVHGRERCLLRCRMRGLAGRWDAGGRRAGVGEGEAERLAGAGVGVRCDRWAAVSGCGDGDGGGSQDSAEMGAPETCWPWCGSAGVEMQAGGEGWRAGGRGRRAKPTRTGRAAHRNMAPWVPPGPCARRRTRSGSQAARTHRQQPRLGCPRPCSALALDYYYYYYCCCYYYY